MYKNNYGNLEKASNLKKGLFGFIFILFVITVFNSCATSIANKEILGINLAAKGSADNSLIPGRSYEAQISASVKTYDNPITNVEWKEIQFESPENLLTFTASNIINVPKFTFDMIEKQKYIINLQVKGNPYPVQTYYFTVNYSFADRGNFNGKNAENGLFYSGKNGQNGTNGLVADFEAAYYNVKGTKLEGTGTYVFLHFHNTETNVLVRKESAPFLISALGGDGSRGSDGESKYLKGTETSVYGGNGYDGGNGGAGGLINFCYPEGVSDLRSLFTFKVDGGKAGVGGLGGSGQKKQESSNPGFFEVMGIIFGTNFGNSGRNGISGPSGYIRERQQKLDTMFLDVTDPLFDRSRLSLSAE